MGLKAKPKFSIIESSYENYDGIYEDFKRDYLSVDITVNEMLDKYNLTPNQYRRLKNRVAEDTGVNRKLSRNTTGSLWVYCDKYIDTHKSENKFKVSKVINNKTFFYGIYDSLEEARYIRDTLEANDWSDECYKELRHDLFGDESYQEKLDRVYEDFKKDFLIGESMRYLTIKYDLTQDMYKVLSKSIRSEMGLIRKPQLNYKVAKRHERNLYRQKKM